MSDEANAHKATDPVELWKNWNETTTRVWSSTLDDGEEARRDPLGFYNFWLTPVMFFKQWCDATGGIWAWMVGGMMNAERFQEANSQYIEAYMRMVRTSRLINEAILQSFQLPTHADITRVTKHIAALEERVYMMEGAFVNFEDSYVEAAMDRMTGGLAERLEQIEGKLDSLEAHSSTLRRSEVVIADLAGRLERVEGKLDTLLDALEKIEARAYPEASWSSNGGEVDGKNAKRGVTEAIVDDSK